MTYSDFPRVAEFEESSNGLMGEFSMDMTLLNIAGVLIYVFTSLCDSTGS